jgi:hypothetical protein
MTISIFRKCAAASLCALILNGGAAAEMPGAARVRADLRKAGDFVSGLRDPFSPAAASPVALLPAAAKTGGGRRPEAPRVAEAGAVEPYPAGFDEEGFREAVLQELHFILPRMVPEHARELEGELAGRVNIFGYGAYLKDFLLQIWWALPPAVLLLAKFSPKSLPAAVLVALLGGTAGYLGDLPAGGTTRGRRILLQNVDPRALRLILDHELAHYLKNSGYFKNALAANAFMMLRGHLENPQMPWIPEFQKPFDQGRRDMVSFLKGGPGRFLRPEDFRAESPTSLKGLISGEAPWTYSYGSYLGGLAAGIKESGRPEEEAWRFLREASSGASPEGILKP